MAGQKGRDVLIKITDGKKPETFITVAGIRTSDIELNATAVDSTAADSPDGWRQLLPGAGLKQARITGRGVFKDAASDRRMRTVFFSGQSARWQLVIPGSGTLTGPMQIASLKWGGTHDGAASFAIELHSAGLLVFEALS